MITFRHLVVSLVAVFLALGLGVLAGTSFVPAATVAALKNSLDRLERRNGTLLRDVERLDRGNDRLNGFAAAAKPLLVRETLRDRPVVLVSFEGTPSDVVDQVAETLVQASARIESSIELSARLDLADEARRRQVAEALEVGADEASLRTTLVESLAGALAGRSAGLLERLAQAGLASVRSLPGGARPALYAPPGSAVVVLGPGGAEGQELAEGVLVPVVRALASASVLVAAGEAGSDRLGAVRLLRQESQARLVTVDGVDTAIGQAALALGLQAAAAGRFGHYGVGDGADGPIPLPG